MGKKLFPSVMNYFRVRTKENKKNTLSKNYNIKSIFFLKGNLIKSYF
jgi:hypothetical protein